ncbi:MAG TPA: hypothetical protein VIM16_03415, partial [Mucilaginibacter sp.]
SNTLSATANNILEIKKRLSKNHVYLIALNVCPLKFTTKEGLFQCPRFAGRLCVYSIYIIKIIKFS